MYIWSLNNPVKFRTKIPMHCCNINKSRRGGVWFTWYKWHYYYYYWSLLLFAGWQFSISYSEQCCILGDDFWPSVGRMVPLLTCCCRTSLPAWHITYQSTQLSCEFHSHILTCPLWLLCNHGNHGQPSDRGRLKNRTEHRLLEVFYHEIWTYIVYNLFGEFY